MVMHRETGVTPDRGGRAEQRVLGIFKRQEDLENAIRALKDNHFNMDRVSLLGPNVDQVEGSEDLGGNRGSHDNTQEGAAAGAVAGTVLGGVGGLLVGLGALIVPGVGPLLAAGTFASTLAGAGIGAAAGGIVGALTSLGIPEEEANAYHERVKQGDYLLMVEGTDSEIRNAESILRNHSIERMGTYRDNRFERVM